MSLDYGSGGRRFDVRLRRTYPARRGAFRCRRRHLICLKRTLLRIELWGVGHQWPGRFARLTSKSRPPFDPKRLRYREHVQRPDIKLRFAQGRSHPDKHSSRRMPACWPKISATTFFFFSREIGYAPRKTEDAERVYASSEVAGKLRRQYSRFSRYSNLKIDEICGGHYAVPLLKSA